MQFKAIINAVRGETGESVDVTFERTVTGIEAVVSGREYSLEVSVVKPGMFLLHWGTRSIEVSVLPEGNMSSISTVSIEGRRITVEILDGRKILQRTVRNSDRGGASEIRSPMPGKIVRVLVTAGADVVAGQGIVVMEAMKMQNEMKSSISGRIRKIEVVEGETVRSGDLIAIVDAIRASE
jgi:acetyl/propionyl-CoA carboxylase alpha subunit